VPILRRVLALQATVSAIAGVALVAAPRFVVSSLFGDPVQDYAWVRVAGAEAFALSLLMVLVGRAESVWWWSWAFVIASGATALVAVGHLISGLAVGSSAISWWGLAVVSGGFTAALVWGLGRTGQERPLP
jgi:hypothetical protein